MTKALFIGHITDTINSTDTYTPGVLSVDSDSKSIIVYDGKTPGGISVITKGKDGATGPQGIQGPKGDTGAQGPAGIGPVAYKGVRVDDGVEVSLDNIVVRLNTGSPRSLQFKLTTGTMSVHISGSIYWSNNGSGVQSAGHWQSKTLTTNWQQPFGWDFPWANDNAVYNLQDMTNGRFYRITLSIGNGYKGNFIIMERLV